jgi:hypothetical protein
MTDQPAAVDAALEKVVTAARAHLAAVKAAGGAVDDEEVWRSYVALNNASFAYDQLLLDTYGEVTPWDTDVIEADGKPRLPAEPGAPVGEDADDPYPAVVSVRQRRDYRVPSVTALLAAGEDAGQRVAPDGPDAPRTVAEAVLELMRDGDGSLGGLDVPELEPLAGVVTVVEVATPLVPEQATDPAALFQVGNGDRLMGRYDEPPYLDEVRSERAGEGHGAAPERTGGTGNTG